MVTRLRGASAPAPPAARPSRPSSAARSRSCAAAARTPCRPCARAGCGSRRHARARCPSAATASCRCRRRAPRFFVACVPRRSAAFSRTTDSWIGSVLMRPPNTSSRTSTEPTFSFCAFTTSRVILLLSASGRGRWAVWRWARPTVSYRLPPTAYRLKLLLALLALRPSRPARLGSAWRQPPCESRGGRWGHPARRPPRSAGGSRRRRGAP